MGGERLIEQLLRQNESMTGSRGAIRLAARSGTSFDVANISPEEVATLSVDGFAAPRILKGRVHAVKRFSYIPIWGSRQEPFFVGNLRYPTIIAERLRTHV